MKLTDGVNKLLQLVAVAGVGGVAIPSDLPTWAKVCLAVAALAQGVVSLLVHRVNTDGTPQSVPFKPETKAE